MRAPSRGEVELGVEARRKREGIAIVIYSAERLRLNTDGDQGDPEFEGEVKRRPNLARRKRVKQVNEREPKQPKIHSCDGHGYFRELLDALPTAVYTTDASGRITFFSQAAVQLSGRAPEIMPYPTPLHDAAGRLVGQ